VQRIDQQEDGHRAGRQATFNPTIIRASSGDDPLFSQNMVGTHRLPPSRQPLMADFNFSAATALHW
jgi:hypothetical protein